MRRTIEGVTTVLAVSAALAGPAKSAVASTVESPPSNPAIEELAAQIDTQPTQQGSNVDIAHFDKPLPGREQASMTLISAEAAHGQPDPNAVTYLGVSVRPASHRKAGRGLVPAPILAVSFRQDADGTWSGYSEAGGLYDRNPASSLDIAEIDQTQVEQYRKVPLDGHIGQTDFTMTENPNAANQLLSSFIEGARELLYQIMHDQEVPPQ
ncbi:MAG TPA: hypothetical protein VII55_00425 [Candidatus Saccharimonadales bacterium]